MAVHLGPRAVDNKGIFFVHVRDPFQALYTWEQNIDFMWYFADDMKGVGSQALILDQAMAAFSPCHDYSGLGADLPTLKL